MDTIETLMGCLMFICLLMVIVEYGFWLIVLFCAFTVMACIVEGIKWVIKKIRGK